MSREVPCSIVQVVYIIEGRILDERLWLWHPNYHDNGIISIGTCVELPCPALIHNQLGKTNQSFNA